MRQLKSKSFDNPIRYEDVPENHPTRLFYDYWKLLCGDRKFALKSDFNPAELPRLLPNIGLVKLDYSGPEFDLLLTLVGERIKELTAISGPGSYRHDFFSGSELEDRLILYKDLSINPRAELFRMKVPFPQRHFHEIIVGMFPFSSEGQLVDYIFLVVEWTKGLSPLAP